MNFYISTLADDSTASRILSLIERHAPRLMRAGGGALSQECGGKPMAEKDHGNMRLRRSIAAERRQRIVELARSGCVSRKEIQFATGAAQSVVHKTLKAAGVDIRDARSGRRWKRGEL